jgi:flavin-dependent dehydrogenase
VAVLSTNSHQRVDDTLAHFPELASRLAGARSHDVERGAVSATRSLRQVYRENVALVGDASGSVDAITGEGLCLTFHQATALADCLAAGSLEAYPEAHRRVAQRPRFIAGWMMAAGERAALRRRAMRALAARPELFERMLAVHVGALPMFQFAPSAVALGWQMLQT